MPCRVQERHVSMTETAQSPAVLHLCGLQSGPNHFCQRRADPAHSHKRAQSAGGAPPTRCAHRAPAASTRPLPACVVSML